MRGGGSSCGRLWCCHCRVVCFVGLFVLCVCVCDLFLLLQVVLNVMRELNDEVSSLFTQYDIPFTGGPPFPVDLFYTVCYPTPSPVHSHRLIFHSQVVLNVMRELNDEALERVRAGLGHARAALAADAFGGRCIA